MKRQWLFLIPLTAFFSMPVNTAYPWGFFAHKKINYLAVFTLPPGMIGFYKKHLEFISEHGVDPDKRRYAVKDEAVRHYIDIDHYSKETNPFEVIPVRWDDAVAKYTEDTLNAYGIVPWWIDLMTLRLTKAFKDENAEQILRLSADIGHYVGDAHVPLHTTENYNGQMTGQHGIHGFWESRLPELFFEEYDFLVGKAKYLDNVLNEAWDAVRHSHFALDSVLEFEAELNRRMPPDAKYGFETRGTTTVRAYSEHYSEAYHRMLDGMVERRMKASVIMTGSVWYTAWVNSGKPDLDRLDGDGAEKRLREKTTKEERQAEEKHDPGRGHED